MRVTLLHPRPPGNLQTHRWKTGHLGLGYIAACLLRDGHEVRILDAKNETVTDDALREHMAGYRPRMFGVTAMTHEIHAAARICEIVKGTNPETVTLVGGPHPTALPERTLGEFPAIDIAVVGEGEETACELARSLAGSPAALDRIQGIAFRDGQTIRRTGNRPWLKNLEGLPFPAWHLFGSVYWPVFASRGCPFGCIFCQRVLGRQVRFRSVDSVLAELDALEERFGQRDVWFQDETFGIDKKWTAEFLDKMIARGRARKHPYTWGCNSRANLASVSLYLKMKQAGCTSVSFGIESGDDAILKRIQKGITREGALQAIAAAKKAGLQTGAFFILGHPGESWKTALQTVHLSAATRADTIAVGIMVPYPGTEVWAMARNGQYGYKLLSEDWRVYDKYFGDALELQNLSRRSLELLQGLSYVWHALYNFRFRELARFILRFRKEAGIMLKRLFSRGRREKRMTVSRTQA